jgi:hypothetical protein
LSAKLIVRDRGWKKFFRNVRQIRDARVRVGVLADTEEGGLHEEGGSLTVAEIAAVNEYGTQDGRIPARPFVRPTFDEQREKLAAMGRSLMGKVLDGQATVDSALNMMGAALAAAIKAKIASSVPPPNAPSTLLKKAGTGRAAGFAGPRARSATRSRGPARSRRSRP